MRRHQVELTLDPCIGSQREDSGRILVFGNGEADRTGGRKPKRLRAAIGHDQMGARRPAQLPEGGEPFVRHPIDRQSQRSRIAVRDEYRPSGAKLGKSTLDSHMIGCPEKAHVTSILTLVHGPSRCPSPNPLKQCSGTCCSLNRCYCNTGRVTIYLSKTS